MVQARTDTDSLLIKNGMHASTEFAKGHFTSPQALVVSDDVIGLMSPITGNRESLVSTLTNGPTVEI